MQALQENSSLSLPTNTFSSIPILYTQWESIVHETQISLDKWHTLPGPLQKEVS